MINRKAYVLAKEITNTMNEINNNTFSKDELKEAIKEYVYFLLNNEKYTILNVLEDEIKNGNKAVIELSKKVLAF